MKIIFKGDCFSPTGIATANREMVKALAKRDDVEIQVADVWNSKYDCNKGLEYLNKAIDGNSKDIKTIFAAYPQTWQGGYGELIGHPIHEGTKIFPQWIPLINQCEKIFVCSESNKNLYKWNDITIPITVIHYGTNPEIYKPAQLRNSSGTAKFTFLSVNSWSGEVGDRKGTDLLLRAFDEEFKEGEAKLILKIGTFWQDKRDYKQLAKNILGHENKDIIIDTEYKSEEDLVKYYQEADCFVAPTKGEGFGLTILNAMACGLPVVVTKDVNSGHMDFCKDRDSVVWIDATEVEQGDPRFYCPGNMLAKPDFEDIKKQMRFAFEKKDELKARGLEVSKEIREHWTWSVTAEKIVKFLQND